MLGDGTKRHPRRAGWWQRLDLLVALIDAGLICARPDGTMDVARQTELELSETVVRDYGIVGVRTLTMTDEFWLAAMTFEEQVTGGQTVYGRNPRDLYNNARTKMLWIRARVAANVPANRVPNYDGFATITDAVRDVFTKAAPVEVRPIRNYYAAKLDPTTAKLADVPPFLKRAGDADDTVDPTNFATARDLIRNSTESAPGRYYHNLYEMAYLDAMTRSMASEARD
jgi:hypothetical protein